MNLTKKSIIKYLSIFIKTKNMNNTVVFIHISYILLHLYLLLYIIILIPEKIEKHS